MNPRARKTLLDAADLIDGGWCQGHASTGQVDDLKRCVLGALHAAGKPSERSTFEAWREVEEAVSAFAVRCGHASITSWNDAPGRTKEEVSAALRTMARRDDESIARGAAVEHSLYRMGSTIQLYHVASQCRFVSSPSETIEAEKLGSPARHVGTFLNGVDLRDWPI